MKTFPKVGLAALLLVGMTLPSMASWYPPNYYDPVQHTMQILEAEIQIVKENMEKVKKQIAAKEEELKKCDTKLCESYKQAEIDALKAQCNDMNNHLVNLGTIYTYIRMTGQLPPGW